MIKKMCLISIMFVSTVVFAEVSSVKIDMEPVIASIREMGNSKVSAYTRGNTVTVYGIVTDEAMKKNIVESVRMQSGVGTIEDLIVVNPTFGKNVPTDSEVKNSIDKALNDLGVTYKNLAVDGGVVSISTDLSSFREVDQMLATILGVEGVKGLKPTTLVKGKPYLSDVTKNY